MQYRDVVFYVGIVGILVAGIAPVLVANPSRRSKSPSTLPRAQTPQDAETIPRRFYLPIGSPGVDTEGIVLQHGQWGLLAGKGRIIMRIDARHPFTLGITHQPTIDPCVGLEMNLDGQPPQIFAVKGHHMALLDAIPLPAGIQTIALNLRVVQHAKRCSAGKLGTIKITGLEFNRTMIHRPSTLTVDDPRLSLVDFWDLEQHAGQFFAWSRASSRISIHGLEPGSSYEATLLLHGTGAVKSLNVGCAPEVAQSLSIGQGQDEPFSIGVKANAQGVVDLCLQSKTWRPSMVSPDSNDKRSLGVAIYGIELTSKDLNERSPREWK